MVALLCIAPLPAAIARPSPHTLRSFLLVVPFIICVAAGFYVLWNKAKLLFIIVTLLLCFEFLLYSHSYFMHYPKTNIPDWGEGYKQMVLDSRNYQKTNTIYVENSLTYAPIYFAFYAPEVRYTMVSNTFATAGKYQKGSSIWIKRFYDVEESEQIVHTTYISSVNRDRFSQFWKL